MTGPGPTGWDSGKSEAKRLEWARPWDQVLDWQLPHAKWFVGGQLNVSVNCLDRHLRGARRNQAALIWEGEPGDVRVLTYWDLHREVCRAANAMRRLGVSKGDRVAIYLPMIPEAAIAMLACARIGAIHSVVFGGLLGRVAARPDQRRRGGLPDHRRRRLSPWLGGAAEALRRRRGARVAPASAT